MSSTISSRLSEAIDHFTDKYRRNKKLEEITGIDAERWSAFNLGRQRPTAEMLEAICKAFPSLCLWLMTGKSNNAISQYDAETYVLMQSVDLADINRKAIDQLSETEMKAAKIRALQTGNTQRTLELGFAEKAIAEGKTVDERMAETPEGRMVLSLKNFKLPAPYGRKKRKNSDD